MHLTYKTVIESVLLSLALGACAAVETVGSDENAGGGKASGAPIKKDATPCEEMPGMTPGDCRIQGSGQMTPSIRK